MDPLIAVVTFAGVALFVLVVGWAWYKRWRAVMRRDREILMHRVLEREGMSLADSADLMDLAQAAAALRRCAVCRDREICLGWLEGTDKTPLEQFCPNAGLIARLKAEARARPAPGAVDRGIPAPL
jgi:hypothetical protein